MFLRRCLIFFIVFAVFTGCVSTKKVVYFNDIEKRNGADSAGNLQPAIIQNGDILQVTVSTIDKDVSLLFNPNLINNNISSPPNQFGQGYLVDNEGNIELPLTGKIYVKGKTTLAINETIRKELTRFLKNVYVSTRLLNFKVSVLGDVARPGSYNVPNERASLLDALSMAGDMNITAVRDDVMLIRDVDGKKTYTSINMNDSKVLSSPYYYLANNDVIYVKPGPNRVFSSSRGFQLLPATLSALSLVTVLLSLLIK
jgi:polysaccharide export outer membrane protein